MRLVSSRLTVRSDRFGSGIRLALLSDLHSRAGQDIEQIIQVTKEAKPDYILMPGDILERLDGKRERDNESGFALMSRACEIAPVIYSIGNHENGGIHSWNKLKWAKGRSIPKFYDARDVERIEKSGAVTVDDTYTVIDGIAFGGLTSGLINGNRVPHTAWLDEFCALDMPKILLCHHPEYYDRFLKDRNIDIIVSGHAHGGQWRFFGRGVYAPGQGLFPRYTQGVHDGRFIISRGLKPGGLIPRFFNSPEVVIIDIEK